MTAAPMTNYVGMVKRKPKPRKTVAHKAMPKKRKTIMHGMMRGR